MSTEIRTGCMFYPRRTTAIDVIRAAAVPVDYFVHLGPQYVVTECTDAKIAMPTIGIIGIEASRKRYLECVKQYPGHLIHAAAWHCRTKIPFYVRREDESWPWESAFAPKEGDGGDQPSYMVDAITLDSLSDFLGPFERSILWADIEGSELNALRGARSLLERKAFQSILVEVREEMESPGWCKESEVHEFLSSFEYIRVGEFRICHTNCDALYVPE